MGRIDLISVDKLIPHPNNPRKVIGDVTELADSIKKSGILQNLTVVPNRKSPDEHARLCDSYTVIIGHRRLAAAKQAGLTEVPCAIVEMSEAEQLRTMLTENMQRSDLTVYEQAEGFQLLLDMDFSVADIAEDTGFSESTIRRRVKLLDLDKDKFKESQARQVTLADYEKLMEVEDEADRNKLLDVIGTADFNNDYKITIDAQEKKKKFDEIAEELTSKFNAVEVKSVSLKDYRWFTMIYHKGNIPRTLADKEYVFVRKSYGIELYQKKEEVKNTTSSVDNSEYEAELRKKCEAFEAEAKDLNRRMYELRFDFIANAEYKAEYRDIAIKFMMRNIVDGVRYAPDVEILEHAGLIFTKEDYEEDTCINFDDEYESKSGAYRILLAVCLSKDTPYTGYIYTTYRNNAYNSTNYDLNKLYAFLQSVGYEMSTEEQQLKEGTHEIFTKYKD